MRLTPELKIIIGRNEDENKRIELFADRGSSTLFTPDGFPGPTALACGPLTEESVESVAALVMRYSGTRVKAGDRIRYEGRAEGIVRCGNPTSTEELDHLRIGHV